MATCIARCHVQKVIWPPALCDVTFRLCYSHLYSAMSRSIYAMPNCFARCYVQKCAMVISIARCYVQNVALVTCITQCHAKMCLVTCITRCYVQNVLWTPASRDQKSNMCYCICIFSLFVCCCFFISASVIVAFTFSVILTLFNIFQILTHYRRNIKLMYKGNYKHLPFRRSDRLPNFILVSRLQKTFLIV